MLDQEDEPEEGNFIHIVSFNKCADPCDLNHSIVQDRAFDSIQTYKVRDWTDERVCEDPEKVRKMQFMLDKKGILYMSVPGAIYAIQLENLAVEGMSQSTSINSLMRSTSTEAQHGVHSRGEVHKDDGGARKGCLNYEEK